MKVYIGIDWSENKHDVCFLDETGEVLLVRQIPHTIAGFRQLDQARQSLGVGRQEVILGLETAHNLLVDYLWDQGYEQIYVLPPAAVKSAQKRYRQSGAKDDRWDAHLIANLLRTDQPCFYESGFVKGSASRQSWQIVLVQVASLKHSTDKLPTESSFAPGSAFWLVFF